MKKISVALLVLLILLSGCVRDSGIYGLHPSRPVSITVWSYYIGEQRKAFDSLVSEFNATVGEEKGVLVQSVSKADVDALKKQVADAANREPGAEELPDLFFAYSDIALMLLEKDLLASYDQYVAQEVFDAMIPGFLDEGRIGQDDQVYILPVAKSTEVLVINKTDFDAFCAAIYGDGRYPAIGYEHFSTWEGIVEAAEAYYTWTAEQAGNITAGKALFGLDSVANFIFSSHRQKGTDPLDVEDGKGILDCTTGTFDTVWAHYYEPMVKGHFAALGRFRSDDFKTGDLLAFLGSNTSATYVAQEIVAEDGSTYPIEVEILPMPVYEGGTPAAIQQGAGMAIVKSEPSREYAASLFAVWFADAERNADFAKESGYLPVTQEAVAALAAEFAEVTSQDPVVLSLKTAINQVEAGYEMYTPIVFQNSYELRTVMENNLQNLALENRRELLAATAGGMPYEEAVALYTGKPYFEAYLDGVEKDLAAYDLTVIR